MAIIIKTAYFNYFKQGDYFIEGRERIAIWMANVGFILSLQNHIYFICIRVFNWLRGLTIGELKEMEGTLHQSERILILIWYVQESY